MGGPDMGGLILYGACNGGPGIVRNVPNPGSVSQQVMERIGEVSFPRQVRGRGSFRTKQCDFPCPISDLKSFSQKVKKFNDNKTIFSSRSWIRKSTKYFPDSYPIRLNSTPNFRP